MKRKLTLCLITLSLLALASCGVDTTGQDPVALKAHTAVQAFFELSETPGLAVAVAVGMGGEVVWSEGFGYADLEQGVAVDPATTLFRIGSVIKPMTALAVAQLVHAGKMNLDAPLQNYVPDFPPKRAPLTTRHLLAHLSGIRHYEGDEFLGRDVYDTVSAGLAIFRDDPLLHEPGERYYYSSYGYNLIGAVIEGASGMPYLDYMAANVLGPLGMHDTVPDYLALITPGRGRYYLSENGVILNAPEVDNSYKWASGGYLGTVEDLVRFGLAHLRDDPAVDLVRQEFWVEQVTNSGEATGYGLGWKIHEDDGGRLWVGHTGGSVGGTTRFWIEPESGLVIAMISNLSRLDYKELVAELPGVFLPTTVDAANQRGST
jgi:CubicO group peptidase (beta-lactamase class C family)